MRDLKESVLRRRRNATVAWEVVGTAPSGPILEKADGTDSVPLHNRDTPDRPGGHCASETLPLQAHSRVRPGYFQECRCRLDNRAHGGALTRDGELALARQESEGDIDHQK